MIRRGGNPSDTFVPAPSITVERVVSEENLRDAVTVAVRTFRFSPVASQRVWGPALLQAASIDVFLARYDGAPVGTVMTTVGGGVVGIWAMATLPERQGQGIGRAVIHSALAYHAARGAELYYLGGTRASRPFYERMGFQFVSEAPLLWLAPARRQARN